MSTQPSPSMSPRATPEPISSRRLVATAASESRLLKVIPVSLGGRSVKPVLPPEGIESAAERKPEPACQTKFVAALIGITATTIKTNTAKLAIIPALRLRLMGRETLIKPLTGGDSFLATRHD